jgi:hypothetical protein
LYRGERAKRGVLLPKGFQQVTELATGLDIGRY